MVDAALFEPLSHDGSTEIGVLVCHGFTGSPRSMRPWAEHLIGQGWSIRLPRLPGHGTTWQDANRTGWRDWYGAVDSAFGELRSRCTKVFAVGLSMGGALALRIAEQHGDAVAGLVLVNPVVVVPGIQFRLVPMIAKIVASVPAIGNDIAKPGVDEGAYPRTPVKAAASMKQLLALVRSDLRHVTQPLRMYSSANDHVVDPRNGPLIMKSVSSPLAERIVLTDSYHVATIDNDAERIFTGSVEFIKQVAS